MPDLVGNPEDRFSHNEAHLVDSIGKLSQGRENWYICREGFPMDDSPGEKCEPVIHVHAVFECMDLSRGQRVNDCVWIVLCSEQGTRVLR